MSGKIDSNGFHSNKRTNLSTINAKRDPSAKNRDVNFTMIEGKNLKCSSKNDLSYHQNRKKKKSKSRDTKGGLAANIK